MALNLRRKFRRRLPSRNPEPLDVPDKPNVSWSMDFMSDSLADGRRFRTLNVLDDFNREALAIEIDLNLPSERVVRVLDQLVGIRGVPEQIRTDNGPEFVSEKLREWCSKHGVKSEFIQPGKPAQNAYIERFNRSYRQGVLDRFLFETIEAVRCETRSWLRKYNHERPHDALGKLTPAEYLAANSTENCNLIWY